jgi:hypothetical protein
MPPQAICRQLREQADREEAGLEDPYSAAIYGERAAKIAGRQARDAARAGANRAKLARAAERAAAAAGVAAADAGCGCCGGGDGAGAGSGAQ